MPTTSVSAPNLAGLRAFVQRDLKPAWIVIGSRGPTIHFWCNPQTYREDSRAVVTETPTLGGYVRAFFGARPQSITLDGTTGTAGWDSGDHGTMKDFDRSLKPLVGRADVRLTLYYPYMFEGPRYCYINRLQQETRSEAPLYYFYTLELVSYPQVGPTGYRAIPESLGTDLELAVPATAAPATVLPRAPATPPGHNDRRSPPTPYGAQGWGRGSETA